jgi:hypothetical protein
MTEIASHMHEMETCIRNCTATHQTCLRTVQHCVRMGGMHADPEHIRVMMDCAEICQASANFMINGSGFHPKLCGICAQICQACEENCRTYGDDELMIACAEACRQCAESCQKMSGRSFDIQAA